MISKNLRLTTSRVTYVLQKGKRLGNNYFALKLLQTKNLTSHFGVTVSTKIYSSAVKRNRLRRQIYEIIRLNYHLLHKPVDLMVITKLPITTLKYPELKDLILKIFQDINHLHS